MYKQENDEVLRLQHWILEHYDLWLRILRLEGTLTEEEFLKIGQEFYQKGLHCANLVMMTNYWDFAQPLIHQNLNLIAELIQEAIEEETEE